MSRIPHLLIEGMITSCFALGARSSYIYIRGEYFYIVSILQKAIDEAFVSSYISLYEESFPEWLNEMDNLMCYRYVLSDNVSDFKLTNKLYAYSSLSQFEDVVNENSIDRMKPCALTKMIIISNDNETKLALVKNKFSELKDWKYKAKSDFFYHTLLRDKTQLIIINRVKGTTENALNGRVFLPQELTK
jgi:hypothetical protein